MKSHEDYVEELALIEPNIEVIGEYIGANSHIEVNCKICGNVWSTVAGKLIAKNKPSKCPECHCKPIGHNDPRYFAVSMPQFAKYLVNIEDGYRYKTKSGKKVDWICPDCGSLVEKVPINKVADRHHIPCKVCSDGISFPNKLMYQMLKQLNEDFIAEYSPEWIAPKRYDFFLKDRKLIIEMDGAIGHGGKMYNGDSGEQTIIIDQYKDNIARDNGMNVVRIDCKKSELDYIQKNIQLSCLSEILDLNAVDWIECERKALSSLQMRVCNLWNKTHDMVSVINESKLSRLTITKYLNKMSRLGFCEYDPKQQQHLSGKRNIDKAYEKNKKPVICLNTGQVFESCRSAYKWLGYNIGGHSIQDNCNGIAKSAGKNPQTNERLQWMFYCDYIKKAV